MEEKKLEEALDEIRKTKERKFDQTVELIINLKKFDIKRYSVNTFITLPNKIKDKKTCGFLEMHTDLIDTIPKAAFLKYKDKKELKKLVKKYDFFISSSNNMPAVATVFGRVLGPSGKMPSPKLGIILQENNEEIKKVLEKINNSIKIQTKEPSIKIPVGKTTMPNKSICDNIRYAYNYIVNELPNNKENVKSIMIKLTMTKPIKIKI